MEKTLYLVGLNYKSAPVEIRERFALTNPAILEKGVISLSDSLHEYLILSTCNRVEIIAVATQANAHEQLLQQWAHACNQPLANLLPHVYVHTQIDAIQHLFTVAASLDSMVLGEPQILGQLKDAYRTALEKKTAKTILNRLLHKAFNVAKRVRSETAVASSAVSISYAAVELAKRIFDDMHQIRAMLIGAGEMAELAATHLVNAGIHSLTVANRTYERAVQLAQQYNGNTVDFSRLAEHLVNVDIIISSTGANEPIIHAKDMREILKKRKNRPMFFIDIAVPRDIDPDVNNLDNVYLYDIDDLKEVVEENLSARKEEASKAHQIVKAETDIFAGWLQYLDLQPTLVDIVRRSEQIAQDELSRTLRKIGPISEDAKVAFETMLNAVIKKINHEPLTFLKEQFNGNPQGTEIVSMVRQMYNLDTQTTTLAANCPYRKRNH